ncbi:DNA-binding protein [Nocardioides silvaticus]|uniref:DNA-binding protein n=1 Tax=Nocardioides silvaticus TaxID=2201891 RepID=A0A316T9C9_9ACTN|nr:helix-turn-helix domain-containing protein [Nocardioides silvaticus]PWN00980.1 DNA-binding protein [Nocardioides silvaticus]
MSSSPSANTGRRFESIPSAAEYLGVAPKTIRRWIDDGRLTGFRAGPRIIVVDRNEIDALLTPIPPAGQQHGGAR